jgi:hypothetical protein
VNEIQIIQQQLATEQQHFADVANAVAASIDTFPIGAEAPDEGPFAALFNALSDYFAFADKRWRTGLGTGTQTVSTPPAQDSNGTKLPWLDFRKIYQGELQKRKLALAALSARNPPIAQWRAIAKIDADSIVTERELYARVKAALPAGVALGAMADSDTPG